MPPLLSSALIAVAGLAAIEAVLSLRGGFEFRRSFDEARERGSPRRSEPESSPTAPCPPACLIVPFRGVDPGLADNLDALFQLDYPDYHLLLVTGSSDDPVVPLLRAARRRHPRRPATILHAGPARGRSQKVHNLLHALEHLREEDRVIAFGDSDVRPHRGWLLSLVAPLTDPGVGVSTGFRWYVPQRGNLASRLRSAWNAGIASLMTGRDSPFAWGGAMAIRRETFERCRVEEAWSGAVSDDFAISRAVHARDLRIRFEPRCLSPTHEDCGFGELLRWSYRQLALTRVYAPKLWGLALGTQLLNSVAVWGGGATVGAALLAGFSRLGRRFPATGATGSVSATGETGYGLSDVLLGGVEGILPPSHLLLFASLISLVYALGCWKARLRVTAIGDLFPSLRPSLRRYRWSYLLSGPLTSLVSLVGLLRSAWSRRVEWRGIRYRMVAPDRTEILRRPEP